MARSRTPKFDASEVITNEIIRIIERGVLPWRKPWTTGGRSRPLCVGGEPYQGVATRTTSTCRAIFGPRPGQHA